MGVGDGTGVAVGSGVSVGLGVGGGGDEEHALAAINTTMLKTMTRKFLDNIHSNPTTTYYHSRFGMMSRCCEYSNDEYPQHLDFNAFGVFYLG